MLYPILASSLWLSGGKRDYLIRISRISSGSSMGARWSTVIVLRQSSGLALVGISRRSLRTLKDQQEKAIQMPPWNRYPARGMCGNGCFDLRRIMRMTLRKDLMWTKTHNTARGTGTEEGCGTATKARPAAEPVACGYRTS